MSFEDKDAAFEAAKRASMKRWDQELSDNEANWRWAMLERCCAMAEVEEDAYKLERCRRTCVSFLEQDGETFIERNLIAWRVTCRFFPELAREHSAQVVAHRTAQAA